jgi:hypothetical protein
MFGKNLGEIIIIIIINVIFFHFERRLLNAVALKSSFTFSRNLLSRLAQILNLNMLITLPEQNIAV